MKLNYTPTTIEHIKGGYCITVHVHNDIAAYLRLRASGYLTVYVGNGIYCMQKNVYNQIGA